MLVVAASLGLTCGPVYAQAPQPAPNDPSNTKKPDATTPAPDASLSKKLDKGEGVIKPPSGVDPEINKGAPKGTGDKMPVIIPPGEPGGDQSVQPK